MAEMVGSAVVGETVSRISSFLTGKHEEKAAGRDNLDRLELAHIKMKAALETSDRCRRHRITDGEECPSLLLWKGRLKRAAEECEEVLQSYKRRASCRRGGGCGGTETEQQQRTGGVHPQAVVVHRYERYAESAGELVKFMEFGLAPRQGVLPVDPLVKRFLKGKFVRYRMLQGSQYREFRLSPLGFTERGLEALAIYVYQDRAAPAKDFIFGLHLRLRERGADIVSITADCMRWFSKQLQFMSKAVEEFDLLAVRNLIHESYVESEDINLYARYTSLIQSLRAGPGVFHGHDAHSLELQFEELQNLSSCSQGAGSPRRRVMNCSRRHRLVPPAARVAWWKIHQLSTSIHLQHN